MNWKEQLDKLTSQIPILRERVQALVTGINELSHREAGDIADQKQARLGIEALTAQVRNYQERMQKIEQAITHITKIQQARLEAERETEEQGREERREKREGRHREGEEGPITFGTALERALFEQASRKLSDKRRETRCEGVREIEQLAHKNKPVMRILIPILQDTNGDVRAQVLESLMKLEAQGTVSSFVDALNDENARVRLAAVRGLYKLAGKSATPFFIRALKDENSEVRERAATYLGWSRGDAAVPEVIRLLDDPDKSIRKASLLALSDIRDKFTVPYLIRILDDPNAGLRRLAAVTLYKWTGESFGFNENAVKSERESVIAEWNVWWKDNKDTFQIRTHAEEAREDAIKETRQRLERVKEALKEPGKREEDGEKREGRRERGGKEKGRKGARKKKKKRRKARKLDTGAIGK